MRKHPTQLPQNDIVHRGRQGRAPIANHTLPHEGAILRYTRLPTACPLGERRLIKAISDDLIMSAEA